MFDGCEKLVTLNANDIDISHVQRMDGMFQNCKSLKDFSFSDKVTEIRECAFYGCDSLTELYVPETVTKITGSLVFSYCDNLTILCHIDSAAAEYARNHNNPYDM